MNTQTTPLSRWHFAGRLRAEGVGPLLRNRVHTVQVNVGKVCNQACLHCHVEAGPKRTESMSTHVAERVLELLAECASASVLDITGGAPELNPSFRALVRRGRELGCEVIDRCNLTVIYEPGMEDLPEFLAAEQVRIVASLPCYTEDTVDAQRGVGTYEKSMAALRKFTSLGYGVAGSGLVLDLAYNPSGAFLPPPQAALESQYRETLSCQGVSFSSLLALSNIPMGRFAHSLKRDGGYEPYMNLLSDNFNPRAVTGLMCRGQVNIGWDGALYDCDFNQMLDMPCSTADGQKNVLDISSFDELGEIPIRTAAHCFGCTAGAGSSCGGALEGA